MKSYLQILLLATLCLSMSCATKKGTGAIIGAGAGAGTGAAIGGMISGGEGALIGAAAGGKGHDQPHRFRGIGLRLRSTQRKYKKYK